MRDDVPSNGVTCSCAEFKAVPSGKLWCPSSLAAEAVIGFGVIGPCLVREAIPQLAGLTELVLGDQGMSSVARVRRVSRRPFFFFSELTIGDHQSSPNQRPVRAVTRILSLGLRNET